MLRRDSFSYSVQARCSPSDAAALLGDLDRQGELHPLIVRVRRLPPRSGARASYTVSDRLTAGPVRFRVRYQADVLVQAEDEIVTVARQWPATTVRSRALLHTEADGQLRIDVEITLAAPALLFAYAFRQARSAHLTLANRLAGALDRDREGPPATS
ncbi:SRPBCC family protein [Micromonospora musae]|uniref:SRPBCC family protein n=1 Tax=Micromonospora musae TaxID=1894970 RepID=UPI0033C9A2CC